MSDTFTLEDIEVIKETAKALLVDFEDESYWIPKSQVDDDSEVWKMGQKGDMIITHWIAGQMGFTED